MIRKLGLTIHGLAIMRDRLIDHLKDLRKQEEQKVLFETVNAIRTHFKFLLILLEEVDPPQGFSDPLFDFICAQSNLCTETGSMFANWASRLYREKIWSRSLRCGTFSETEKLLILIDRPPTEKEVRILAEKTRWDEEGYKRVLLLAEKYHPRMVYELQIKK